MPKGTVMGADRRALADALADIRAGTGLSQEEFGARVGPPPGHHQTWVSKIATGKIVPSDQSIREWCAAGGADPGPLLGLAPRARIESRTVRDVYEESGGGAGYQAALGDLIRETAVFRKFQPCLIPAEVQVVPYAEALLSAASGPVATGGAAPGDIPGIVAQRMRNQDVLYQAGRMTRLVMLEAALRHPMAPPPAMRAQLDRLLAVGGAPSLELGIIPAGRVLPVAPLTGFVIFDESLVTIESAAGPTDLADPDEVARFLGWFDLLVAAAVYGDEAAALVHAALPLYQD